MEYKYIFWPLLKLVSKIFQQDGAPPHWGSHVRRVLVVTFPNRWIGRDGPTPWPPRSPDITPLDFFLWGMLRTKCFRNQFQIRITNLKARITATVATITEYMLENTRRKIYYRLDVLRATKGAHVEVYWCVVKNLLELSYILKKIYIFIPRSFLVINVCNQGMTLCSLCIFM